MAPRGVAPILPLALALTAVAAVSWARGPSGTLWSRQGCAALGRCCPGRDPTCAARGPPRCFCDQACREVRDCCPDYARACPVPALITTGSYGKEREKRGVPKKQETIGYCVQFRLGPVPGSCQQVRAPHAQWTRYLTQGHTVCVRCEWPAQDARSRRCYGDGGGAGGHQLSLWQAAGHPRCRGTWERLGQLRDCSCPEVHSLVFL
ncbi:somatomedin-B and thrombospondin type-1 domain-containing protein-like isoform X10 [Delphinapterus leucas]|uniref:Somatomedin-B and thrombospondin type-1 domain-containing protein-like isoform X10 n=1 Tax=Delphinapterus leucas TaxID=9749 RepID=A0A2Y9QCU3_DELLE|nr:somatomedin-B and thrombospondin type-1 domain-containing protein-like isoform X10 [Delphinapterus leucas]